MGSYTATSRNSFLRRRWIRLMANSPLKLRTWRSQGNTSCWSWLLVRQPRWRSTTRLCARMGFLTSATSKSQANLLLENCKGIILEPQQSIFAPPAPMSWCFEAERLPVEMRNLEKTLVGAPVSTSMWMTGEPSRLGAGSWDRTQTEVEAGESVPGPELVADWGDLER